MPSLYSWHFAGKARGGGGNAPAGGDAPAWLSGAAVGEWVEISNTAVEDAPLSVTTYPSRGNTGPSSKVTAWCGFSIDTRDSTLYTVANGGHADYAGNEVQRITLEADVPAWEEAEPSTAVADIPTIASGGPFLTHYADGKPTSRHSYWGTWVNEVRNVAMIFAGSRWSDNGATHPALDGFDLSTLNYKTAGTYPNETAASDTLGWAMCDVKATGDLYAFANFAIRKWTSSSNTWGGLSPSGGGSVYGQWCVTAHDSSRNRIMIVGGSNSDYALYDIGANSLVDITLTGAEAGSIAGTSDFFGMCYDEANDRFLFSKGESGGVVYAIQAASPYAATLVSTSGGSPPAGTHVCRRFLYVPTLGGVIYIPTYSGNLWFLRTS
jgi:hypothetical protein